MPVLSNAKHEAVAQLAAKGIDGTHAYLTVYPKCGEEAARRNASRLLTKADVKARVQELTSRVAERVVAQQAASAIDLLNRLWEIGSSDEKDRVPALSAMRTFYPEFRDSPVVDNSQHIHLPEGLSVEELRRLASGS